MIRALENPWLCTAKLCFTTSTSRRSVWPPTPLLTKQCCVPSSPLLLSHKYMLHYQESQLKRMLVLLGKSQKQLKELAKWEKLSGLPHLCGHQFTALLKAWIRPTRHCSAPSQEKTPHSEPIPTWILGPFYTLSLPFLLWGEVVQRSPSEHTVNQVTTSSLAFPLAGMKLPHFIYLPIHSPSSFLHDIFVASRIPKRPRKSTVSGVPRSLGCHFLSP